MRYDVVEGGFVVLLANLEVCRIGECGGVGGGVGNAVGRGMREGVVGFGREATSAHDIDFEGGEAGGEAGGAGA